MEDGDIVPTILNLALKLLVVNLKNDTVKLFDSIKRYDDGACYFDDKLVGAHGDQGPLSASSSVVRGITALAGATSESLNLPGEKILGLAKFFLGIGVPGSAKELYHQIDALACLEKIRGSIPLILSLPSSVLSVTRADQLKVRVNTVLGSVALPLTVNLRQIFVSGSKDASVVNHVFLTQYCLFSHSIVSTTFEKLHIPIYRCT